MIMEITDDEQGLLPFKTRGRKVTVGVGWGIENVIQWTCKNNPTPLKIIFQLTYHLPSSELEDSLCLMENDGEMKGKSDKLIDQLMDCWGLEGMREVNTGRKQLSWKQPVKLLLWKK